MPAASDDLGFTPTNDIALQQFVGLIRSYMRDHAELNRLFQGEEHSDRLIAFAVIDAMEDFNTTPPMTNYRLNNFPSKSLLRMGTIINLLESVGLLMTRNHISFSDGGVQVGVSDKTPLIQSWIQLLTNKYETKKDRLKVALNIEGGWGGGVHSEYLWTSGFYGGY